MKFNVPNSLTLIRLILIPVIIIISVSGSRIISMTFFALAALTDFFDGYFARKLNQETAFGALFDPIVDRIFAICFFGYLLWNNGSPLFFLVIVLLRNVSQLLSVPVLIWWLKRSFKVKPKWYAKWATALSDFAIILLFYFPRMETYQILQYYFTAVAVLELWILSQYLPRAYQIATLKHDTFE